MLPVRSLSLYMKLSSFIKDIAKKCVALYKINRV